MTLYVLAPAKVNWFLSITGKRDDGYHNIRSLMQCVSLYDTLSFEDSDSLELISDMNVPVEENLVFRAAVALKHRTDFSRGVRIKLKKDIPLAAGLGGGSSDAATTLLALNRLWNGGLSSDELLKLASEIGSDVPFFIKGPRALIEGRGDQVISLATDRSAVLVLVKPDIEISAAWAYRAFDISGSELTKEVTDIKLFCLALDNRDFNSLQRIAVNDLEAAVLKKYPVIEDIKDRLISNGAVISVMSGSGPTVFGVFKSLDEASRAAENMGNNWCRVVTTLHSNEKKTAGK